MRHLLMPCLLALAAGIAFDASAQALPNAPKPLATDTELALAQIESMPELIRIADAYGKTGDWRRYGYAMKRISQLRPFAGNIKYEMAAAYAMQDMKTEAYDSLVRLQTTGYAFDLEGDDRLKNLHGTGVWKYLVANFKANEIEFGSGKVAFEIPKGDQLIESIAWDANGSRFLAGAMRTGEIFVAGKDGKLAPFAAADEDNGMWGVFDLLADVKRDVLWVASTADSRVKHAKAADFGRAGVWRFKLSDGSYIGKAILPADQKVHELSSLAINPNGDVFVGDSYTRQIFKLEGDTFRVVVQNPKLTSIRALAASDDNKFLYFADYELGLFGLELDSGRAFDVAVGQHQTLFSIEDIEWYEGTLIAVQNGFTPRRVMRFNIDATGKRIVRAQALDAAHKAWGLPTRGTMAGDKYYFVSNTQKNQYDRYGLVMYANDLRAIRIWESDARFAWKAKGQVKPLGKPD
jgi:hypothetical protein